MKTNLRHLLHTGLPRWGKDSMRRRGLPWLLALVAAQATAQEVMAQAIAQVGDAGRATVVAAEAVQPASAAQAVTQIAAPACFDEAQWQALQQSTAAHMTKDGSATPHKALLYVWSPRMVFSAIHAHDVQQEAQALGLRFVPVHDGRLPPEEVAQALAVLPQKLPAGSVAPNPHPLQSSQALCAPSLVARDAYRHFPTAWVVQQGSFHPVPLVSAMPPQFWRLGLQQRLQQAGSSRQPTDTASSP